MPDVRKLKNIPKIPLSYELVALDKGFTFQLDGVEIHFKNPTVVEWNKFINRISILRPLYLDPKLKKDQAEAVALEIEKALSLQLYNEILEALLLFLSPLKTIPFLKKALLSVFTPLQKGFLTFRQFLLLQDQQTVFDLWMLCLFSQTEIKKKVVDTLVGLLKSDYIRESWMTGVSGVACTKLSVYERMQRAFSG